jgi:hypothetical protein
MRRQLVLTLTSGGQRHVYALIFSDNYSAMPQVARATLHWDRPFQTVRAGGFETGDIVWFPEGGLNASYNCVDRWAFKHPNKVSAPPIGPILPSY